MTSAYNHREANSHSVQMRMPPSLINRVDEWAAAKRISSRSEAIRTLIDAGLDQKEAQTESGPAR